MKTCATCPHVKTARRKRKFAKTAKDSHYYVHYCGLSGAEVLSAMTACNYYDKSISELIDMGMKI